jgi:hypothetical protein
MATEPGRRRPRPGSLERPVSGRLYRTAWVLVAVPILVLAFSVARPEPLPRPDLPPAYDEATALQFATDYARRFPDRSPGTRGAAQAADWVAARLGELGLEQEREEFSVEVAGEGRMTLVNLAGVAPGPSSHTIVVMAHRDNLGRSPGAVDNASGLGALLELARNIRTATHAHTFVFLTTDGGAYGGLGAAQFARTWERADQIVAVVNLDAVAGPGSPRVQFAGDTPRSPAATLVATADARILEETGQAAARPSAGAQLVDLAFPFNLYEQAPFVVAGTPAITLTTTGDRPRRPEGDTVAAIDAARLGEIGRSANALLVSLDDAGEVAGETESYVYMGSRLLRGWTIQLLLLAALTPFFAAVVDLFARSRRRHVALLPALRSLRSRIAVWGWAGLVFAVFVALGLFPEGVDRPIAPDTLAATDWPLAALGLLCGLVMVGWLLARPRLAPSRAVERPEKLAGHLAAMLALVLVAVVVAAANPYTLLLLLPSLHAWLWLPHVADRGIAWRVGLWAVGLAGPLVLLASFGFRFDLGFDAPWYVAALAAVGYVPLPLLLAFLLWGAAAGQLAAIALGRYAPYPERSERPARGPIREAIRQVVFLGRRRRARPVPRESEQADALVEQP